MKQLMEARLAGSLVGRLELHSTRYRWTRNEDGRIWITFDKQEVASFAFWSFHNERYRLARQIRQINRTTDYSDLVQREGYYRAEKEAIEIAHREGFFDQDEFIAALHRYLSLSIDDALRSEDVLIRAVAMLDRRLGKRRLRTMRLGEMEHPLVKRMLGLRLKAEGIELTASSTSQ